VLKRAIEEAGLTSLDERLPASVHVQHGVNRIDRRIYYYFNYSGTEVKLKYAHGAGTDLLDERAVTSGLELTLAPWDLAIIEESATATP
jgi:beta-galactosidase